MKALSEVHSDLKKTIDHLETLAPHDRTARRYLPRVREISELLQKLLEDLAQEWYGDEDSENKTDTGGK